MGLGWGPLCFSGSIGLVISSTLETQCQLPLAFSYPGVSVYVYLATVGVPMRMSTLGWEPRQGYPAGSRGTLSFAFGPPQRPLLSVPVLLSICIFLELEFSLFHLSSQHRACLSPPLSTSALPSLQQPELRAAPLSLWQLRFLPWLTSEVFVLLPERSS